MKLYTGGLSFVHVSISVVFVFGGSDRLGKMLSMCEGDGVNFVRELPA